MLNMVYTLYQTNILLISQVSIGCKIKSERRHHYYALKDKSGIIWLIPMSTQVENYKRKIEREEIKRGKGNCIYYHIGKLPEKREFLL